MAAGSIEYLSAGKSREVGSLTATFPKHVSLSSIITGGALFLRVCIIPRTHRKNSLTNASHHMAYASTNGPSAIVESCAICYG